MYEQSLHVFLIFSKFLIYFYSTRNVCMSNHTCVSYFFYMFILPEMRVRAIIHAFLIFLLFIENNKCAGIIFPYAWMKIPCQCMRNNNVNWSKKNLKKKKHQFR